MEQLLKVNGIMKLARSLIVASPLARLAQAPSLAQTVSDLPQVQGECVITTITDIHPRLGNHPGDDPTFRSGTVVEFGNGGRQVSYERVETILASRPGDEVKMCLSFIPGECPTGDVRGREYRVLNMRTGESWDLPDSAHYCGGA
ncbi:hypothetical protein [Rhizobium halophilum]|uniref:hypothetical protein n=1 Tax=Rhizobium halophilum TaxID=2846852 RepID=UPI001EFD7368|nr:hypothetical protein [Rhizobium halophilum]MCF6367717.1 hypothetical protein [Rhizobium halophilum]